MDDLEAVWADGQCPFIGLASLCQLLGVEVDVALGVRVGIGEWVGTNGWAICLGGTLPMELLLGSPTHLLQYPLAP